MSAGNEYSRGRVSGTLVFGASAWQFRHLPPVNSRDNNSNPHHNTYSARVLSIIRIE